MVKGAAIKFKSYQETVPKLLALLKLDKELVKHSTIVLKPSLKDDSSTNTKADFVEGVLTFCLKHKNPNASVFIAEGSDGIDTNDMFEKEGYKALADKYSIGLMDLNYAETEPVRDGEFLKFQEIYYPKILLDAFIISLPPLAEDPETEIHTSVSAMLGAFPSRHYSGFFSSRKNKIRKWPIKYSIHDILKCKMPQFTVIDTSEKGAILAGLPIDMDKQAAKLLGKDWRSISHLKLADESFALKAQEKDA